MSRFLLSRDHADASVPCSYGASPDIERAKRTIHNATLLYMSAVKEIIGNVNEELRGNPIKLDAFESHVEEAYSEVRGLLSYVQEREMGL